MNLKSNIIISLCFVIFIFTSCSNSDIIEIYVATNGNDEAKGTINTPLKSLEGAKNRIRAIRAEREIQDNEIKIYFREGTYHFDKTVAFSKDDSGLENIPVVYTSYNNEKVSFSGGIDIEPSKFKPVKDENILERIIDENSKNKILQADLKSMGITDYGVIKQHGFSVAILPAQMELFVNGEPQTLSRWPNEGRVDIIDVIDQGSVPFSEQDIGNEDFSNRGGTIVYGDDRHALWQEPGKIWLWGFFKAGYADDNLGVASIDTSKKTIKLKHPHLFGIAKTNKEHEWTGRNAGYYAYNILEEIDMPGEYYIDRNTGILYYYPGDDFGNAEVTLTSLQDPLIALEGVSNLAFEDIDIEYGKGMGIYIERGANNQFRGCNLRNFGTLAVMFGKGVSGIDYPIHEFTGELKSRTIGNLKAHHYGNTHFYNEAGKNHGLIGCNIYNTGSGGIVLSGGNRTTLEEGGNYVKNCEFHHTNRRNKTYCAQITLYGVANKISNCYFHDAPHLGVAIFGNEHVIEYSRFERLVKDIHDAGAIGIGRNPSQRGNKILYNYFANLGSKGFKNTALHLDDGSSLLTIKGNIFHKASKMDFGDVVMNGCSDILVTNNIFIEGAHGLWLEDPVIAKCPFYLKDNGLDSGGIYWQRNVVDLDITSPAWAEKYPEFVDFFEWETPFLHRNKVTKNVFYRTPYIISKHGFDSTRFEVWEHNWITDEDPGFFDISNNDFTLKENAVVFRKIPGFKPIPFNKIGLYKDRFRIKL